MGKCATHVQQDLEINTISIDNCNGIRDRISTKMIEMINNGALEAGIQCVLNPQFVKHFVTYYLEMRQRRRSQVAKPKVLYHWTPQHLFDPIIKHGLQVPDGTIIKHTTDTGYYGRGIYMSPDPNYAQSYGKGATLFFVTLALPGLQYIATRASHGQPLMTGYDSHISKDRNEMEWVFF